MSNRNSLLFQAAMRRRWVVTAVAVFVLLIPLPMWYSRHQDTQDRQGRDTVTVVAIEVREEGNDDLVMARIEDKLISFTYPGKISAGDRVEIYRSNSQWHAVAQAPLWVPIAATALCWVPAGIVLAFYPGLGRRRGWAPPKRVRGPGPDEPGSDSTSFDQA